MKRIALVIASFLAIGSSAPALPAAPPVSAGLHPCSPTSPFFCGTIVRALDPTGTIPGTIGIHFEWLPHSDRGAKSEGVIIANEGGPGSGSTESRASYRALFAPLLDRRDMLLMDNRGTGESRVIDCEPLQSTPVMKYPDIERCGVQLGKTAALYGTGLAADDLAAIMDEMRIRTADLYGDSYGTFFVQTFAGRHPHRVRSLILDGAYPVVGESPWYPEAPAAVRRAFNTVCRRAEACDTLPGSSMDRVTELLTSLRKQQASGVAPVGDRSREVTVAAPDLAFVMDASGLAVVPFRELDAAARAYLKGDALPLLRLTGESYQVNESAGSAFYYSRGLFTAVSCADYPQAYDASEQEPARHQEWLEAQDEKRAREPDIYAPFSLDEWLGMPPDYSVLTLCLNWPVPLESYPPGHPVPPGTIFPDVPVLVISGEIDTVTPAAQGAEAAALFPHATQVVMANSAHVDAMEDPFDCASRIAQRFVATLHTGDTSCAQTLPELRTVPRFERNARELAPADPLPGNLAGDPQLRAAAAAVQTIGDSLARTLWDPGPKVLGLRGGSFTFTFAGNAYDLQLDGVRWTEDLAVSGTARSVFGTGTVESRVTIHGISSGTLFIRWKAYDRHAMATATGTLDGETVRASLPAP